MSNRSKHSLALSPARLLAEANATWVSLCKNAQTPPPAAPCPDRSACKSVAKGLLRGLKEKNAVRCCSLTARLSAVLCHSRHKHEWEGEQLTIIVVGLLFAADFGSCWSRQSNARWLVGLRDLASPVAKVPVSRNIHINAYRGQSMGVMHAAGRMRMTRS